MRSCLVCCSMAFLLMIAWTYMFKNTKIVTSHSLFLLIPVMCSCCSYCGVAHLADAAKEG